MIKTNIELASAAEKVAKFSKTLYVLGCFGAPMNEENKNRYSNNLPYNQKSTRKAKIQATSADTFGFDCVCFIKGLLWGWEGDTSKEYGGAEYQSNGVPDINADSMIKACKDVSTDFSNIQVGEFVWFSGHCGVYIGDGLVAECTHRWADGVQITAVHNICQKAGYNGRSWTKHGKLPWITYVEETAAEPQDKPLKVYDVVYFNANLVYNSEDAATGSMGKSGEAKITKIVPGAAHPIHLQRTGSVGPWGWVDESSIQKPTTEDGTTPAPTKNIFSLEFTTMRRGDKGETVRALQILLAGRGCNGNMHTPDGSFGPNTEGAVKIFQEKEGLTVDGIAGPYTMKKLLGV